jgi:hypothetical protein
MASIAEKRAHAAALPVPDGWFTATNEQLVSTDFGQIAVRVGGNEQKPVMVFWPSLALDGSMWSYQFEHYAPNYGSFSSTPPGLAIPLRYDGRLPSTSRSPVFDKSLMLSTSKPASSLAIVGAP